MLIRALTKMMMILLPAITLLGCTEFGPLSDLTPGRFNNNPVTLIDAFFFGGPGMDLHGWVSVELAQPGDLSVFRMKKTGLPAAGNQDIRIVFEALRGTVRTFRWFPVSPIQSRPWPSKNTEMGTESSAALASPPSPADRAT